MSAATGMLRPNKVIGMKNACTRGKQPQSTPSGTPTSAASPKPKRQPPQRGQEVAGQGPVKPETMESSRMFRPGSKDPSTAR